MTDDIRPKGTVQVKCSDATCVWQFWIDPLDPRLPEGPFYCGANHTSQARVRLAQERLERAGMHFCSASGTGCGGSDSPDDGPGDMKVRLHDPELEYRHEYGGNQDNYGKGKFAVIEWNVIAELEQASLDPADYEWVAAETAWARDKTGLPGGTEIPKEDYPEAPN